MSEPLVFGFLSVKLCDVLKPLYAKAATGVKSEFRVFEPDALKALYEESDILFLEPKDVALVDPFFAEKKRRPSLVVCAGEEDRPPECLYEGNCDDLLVLPARSLDLFRVVRLHFQLDALRAVEQSSQAIPALVQKIQEDLHLAQKIQRRLIKDKFPPMPGLLVKSKYWCGMKSGGDYFDVFEFPDGQHVGILLTDSSSYALSTNFLSSLMQLSAHVAHEDTGNPTRIVKTLYKKIEGGLKEKDKLSIFYGILCRKSFQMRYLAMGDVYACHQSAGGAMSWIARGEGEPLSKEHSAVPEAKEILLEPSDRFLAMSDGWAEGTGSSIEELVRKHARPGADAQDMLNEFAFSLRKGVEKDMEPEEISEEFPMPPQDCSMLIIDVAKNVLRLAK